MWFMAWLATYSKPAGREEEPPQLNNNVLRAIRPASANTPVNFDIDSP